jgi:general transcription factor 3C polypeptide 5 (transcription factor C subunit 1)
MDPTKRLELYFRPKDPYCHPVCANRFSTSSLLLRIKKRTRRRKGELGAEANPEVTFDMEILGIVSTIYKFQGNCKMSRGEGLFNACREVARVICTRDRG